jgi:hypothetical protein
MNYTRGRVVPQKDGSYDNSSVDFTKPVQYGIYDFKEGGTEWVECVIDPDGKNFRTGIAGTGRQFGINEFPLRNHPLSDDKALDDWYQSRLKALHQEFYDLRAKAEQRKMNVSYRREEVGTN